MKVSKKGIEMIKSFEGLRLNAYRDAAGIRTIGYGHAYWEGADTITMEQAEDLLCDDLYFFERTVESMEHIYSWKQHEFDAMVSFCFNIGSIAQLTANGRRDRHTIADKMLLYNKSGGKVLKGLKDRRAKERDVFLHGYDGQTSDYTEDDYIKTACRVILGQYGNGEERKKALEKEGYFPSVVQDYVNAMLNLKI